LLVLAGHDPTGGAGIDADAEAAAHFGVAADLVITAFTEQDGRRVQAVEPRAEELWMADARSAIRSARPSTLKTGLLPGAAAVHAVARLLTELSRDCPPVCVVDPVLAASGGETFLDDEGIEALLDELVTRGVILTPNVPEAARLAGLDPAEVARDLEARLRAAEVLLGRGAGAVLLKGGHGGEDPVSDLVLRPGAPPAWIEHPRVPGPGIHGSGCRYATGVAAQLAVGRSLEEAAKEAALWLAEKMAVASPE
jgi:hydroxymethylpyrimidine/phosphomethylpyrimidine kinase